MTPAQTGDETMTEPTPGPWELTETDDGKTPELWISGLEIDSDSAPTGWPQQICQMARLTKAEDEVRANAHLIAAAPDLLAACEHAARSEHHPACEHTHPSKCSCHVEKARAAIARAKMEE